MWPSRTSQITLHPNLEWLSHQPRSEEIRSIAAAFDAGQVIVHWPQRLRPGEWGKISLGWIPGVATLSLNNQGASPLRSTLTMRLEVSGGHVEPVGVWREVVDLRKALTLNWRIVGQTNQPIQGTLWMYIQPSSVGDSSGMDLPILAWPFAITVAYPLGIPSWVWGGLGGLAWMIALIWRSGWIK
ncbi:MAG: hypothetical protein N3A60_01840 [Thermanaerothrix sp.]|nr:hypothetical protein [Thermanaerothrix sp.]